MIHSTKWRHPSLRNATKLQELGNLLVGSKGWSDVVAHEIGDYLVVFVALTTKVRRMEDC